MTKAISVENLTYSYPGVEDTPGVTVFTDLDLTIEEGSFVAVLGGNGCGKSTLAKHFNTILLPSGGKVHVCGMDTSDPEKQIAIRRNVGMVFQNPDNQIVANVVEEDVAFGPENLGIASPVIRQRVDDALKQVGMYEYREHAPHLLSGGQKQRVAIAGVIAMEPKCIVLDEPTAALTQTEVEELFKIMNDLKEKGIGMIYISHRMDEINRISDRVTVMRDGEYVGTVNTAEVTKDDIVKMMVGRVIMGEQKACSTCPADADIILEVKNLNAGKEVKNVSFQLRRGEILGFAGLMGAGRTEVARALYGADKRQTGEIFINGKKVKIKTPAQAVKAGICYLSEDRKRFGLMLDKSVTENSALASVDDYITAGLINDKKMRELSAEANAKLRTKTPSMEQLLKNLSGGNQQKVIIARWLMKNSDIFIFDEPTRGIDVGAKSEIYALMDELVKQGKSIIMISSELPEVLRMSDRIIVMCEGRKTGELDISEATQENIMQLATMREEN